MGRWSLQYNLNYPASFYKNLFEGEKINNCVRLQFNMNVMKIAHKRTFHLLCLITLLQQIFLIWIGFCHASIFGWPLSIYSVYLCNYWIPPSMNIYSLVIILSLYVAEDTLFLIDMAILDMKYKLLLWCQVGTESNDECLITCFLKT